MAGRNDIPSGIGNDQLFAVKKSDFCVRKPRQSTHSVCVFCLELKFFLYTNNMVKPYSAWYRFNQKSCMNAFLHLHDSKYNHLQDGVAACYPFET